MQGQSEYPVKHRVITMLDRKELDFLDKLSKDALFTTGHKLSYNAILRGLIDFAIEMQPSGENIESLNDLKEKLLKKCNISIIDHGNSKK